MSSRQALLIALMALAGCGGEFDLPRRMEAEEVVQDMSRMLEPASVAEQAPEAAVALGWIQPSQSFNADGGYRHAIVAPPPAVLRYRVDVPKGAALRFAVAVQGSGRRESGTAGIRFSVAIDGRERFARTINPASTRHDRRWFDERVDLGAVAEREAEITLRTERAGRGEKLAGIPGWADLRIVRESRHERQTASPEAPNVLLVVVDTLRADRLGCYGARPSPSPALDRLAAEGVVFEHMVAQSSWTMPSVATILTGLHPRDHGLVGWAAGALSNAHPTLAERAALAGITTIGVSANPLISKRTNFARGFETFVDFGWDQAHKEWPGGADVNRTFLGWLEKNHRHRFLAYLQYMEPHDPYTPPAELRPAAADGVRPEIAAGHIDGFARKVGGPDVPPLADPEVRHLRALYDAEIRAWDAALAEVLAALDRLGLRDSTVVVVTADHGEEFQEHGRLKHGFHLYEESVRVPLVIAGPSFTPARLAEQAQGIDVFPTVAALLGVGPPPGLPGQSLVRAVEARPTFSETHRAVGADGTDIHLLAVRTPGWKLIHTPALDRYELYDLVRDAGERENRFGAVPESEELLRLLAGWEATAPQRPRPVAPDPSVRERLRALGYVQ